ncbi:MAG: serine/threonine-protein kinase [Polyangiaceae bacterium]|jgi:serine/threonine-protein kinase
MSIPETSLHARATQAPLLDVGDVLDGRYQLLRDLGRGAAGIVYEARHLFTGRFVAVKLLVPQARRQDHAKLRARLEREGRALASIHHPGVVEVLDGGLTPEGDSYLVMEMLEGRTLEGLLAARGKLSVTDTVGIALQLCDALEAVHRAEVVHRDVKPANIVVLGAKHGAEVVKLVDFGIAKLLDPAPDDRLTQPGAIIGTPAYLTPELLLGEGAVDPSVDVYSLGVIMYECLSGAVPHDGHLSQVLLSATGDEPTPSVRSRAPDVPPALARVIDRAISKTPEARFASARELAAAVERAVPGGDRRTALRAPRPHEVQPAPVDQRRAARVPYNTPVRIVVGEGVVDGRSEDISADGLLVLTRAVCRAGQRVPVRFALPMEGKVVSVEADVRWVRRAGGVDRQGMNAIGLAFGYLPVSVRDSIGRYIALMSEKGGVPSGRVSRGYAGSSNQKTLPTGSPASTPIAPP